MLVFALSTVFFVFVVVLVAAALLVATLAAPRLSPNAEAGATGFSVDGVTGILRNERVSSIGSWSAFLERFNIVSRLRTRIEEAGLNWSAGRAIAMMLFAAAASMALLAGRMPHPLAAGASCFVAAIPGLLIERARSRRLRRFQQEFPDALESLCRALKAGQPFSAAMEILAAESAAPVSTEIRRTIEEWKLGMSWDHSLENLSRRIPLVDVAVFTAAVKLQKKSGGKLGDVLSSLAEGMRENAALQGEVRSLAAHGRMTGAILNAMPIILALIMYLVSPAQIGLLFDHPMGRLAVYLAVAALVAAHFIMRKMVEIKL
jgi:tight adherence protein B